MNVTLEKSLAHQFKIGDIFVDKKKRVRMIVNFGSTMNPYCTLDFSGNKCNSSTSIGLLLNGYESPEFIGRLKVR